MNTEQFINAYNEPRNGINHWCRNPLYPKFLYSDGVRDCAEAGCYWLLDILGTELPRAFNERDDEYMCVVYVKVKDSEAVIVGEFHDDDPKPYRREIDYTDMPDGVWMFYVTDSGDGTLTCILPKEY